MPRPPRLRSLVPWLAAWLALTALAVALHLAIVTKTVSWLPARLLNNAVMLLTLPGWAAMRLLRIALGTPHAPILAIALGVAGIVVALMIAIRARTIAVTYKAPDEPDASRRRFLVNAASAAVVLPPAAVAAQGITSEPFALRIVRHRLTLRGFGADVGELTVVNVTDTHLGTRVPASFVRRAYTLAIAQNPDIAVMTGDFLYNDASRIDEAARLAEPFIQSARLGAFAVLGNHDHWVDGPAMAEALRAVGAHVIDNAQRLIALPGSAPLRIAGLGDLTTDDTRPADALLGPHRDAPTILLAHQPDTAEHPEVLRAVEAGARVDAMLAGHTHGGQVRVPFMGTPMIPSRYGQKYAQGLVQGPAFPVIVSAGVGMSILPVRWGVPPEITVVTVVCRA